MRELKLAFRSLIRTPFVTIVAIVSLALGIGANAAIYSMMDATLLRSLPVQAPDRLVNIEVPGPNPGSQSCSNAGGCDEVLSYPMLRDLQNYEARTLTGLAGHVGFGANIAFDGRTTAGSGMQVTGNYFDVLGVRPAVGRLLGVSDDEEIGGHFVTVLTHAYWQNDLGGDPNVLNSQIVINGQSFTVVGVTEEGFRGTVLGSAPDLFVPMTMRAVVNPWFAEGFDDRRWYWAYAFARLAPGATRDAAQEELTRFYNGVINEVEAPLQEGMTEERMVQFRAKEIVLADGFRGQSTMHEEVETPFRMLMGITALVLIIACANIANLLLARGASRSTEMAVRGSLGASRGQLLRQLMLESMLLSVMAGIGGIVAGIGTLRFLATFVPPEAVDSIDMGMNGSVLLFTALVSLGTGVLFGLYPALHASRTDLATLIRAGSGKDSGARSASRFRNVLVTAQIALSMTLLVSAGLFAKSLSNVAAVDLGLDAEQVVQFTIAPEMNGYEIEESRQLVQRLETELRAIPGVSGATASLVPILSGSSWGNDVSVQGFEWEPGMDANSRFTAVGAGFYSTMGIPLLSGREFTDADVADEPRVAIINEAFARKFGLDPRTAVGTRMARGSGADELDMEIVGVVQNAAYSDVKDEVPPVFTVPYMQDGFSAINLYVRATADPATVVSAIRQTVSSLDANLPIENLRMFRETIDENIVLDRLIGTLSTAFALLATLLAAVGLYGVLSYAVAQRTREIGVRMALGAAAGSVRSLVLRQVVGMTVVGGVIGLLAAFWVGGIAESLLFGLEGRDPVVMLGTVVTVATVALTAAYLPARRASRVDPIEALRAE